MLLLLYSRLRNTKAGFKNHKVTLNKCEHGLRSNDTLTKKAVHNLFQFTFFLGAAI